MLETIVVATVVIVVGGGWAVWRMYQEDRAEAEAMRRRMRASAATWPPERVQRDRAARDYPQLPRDSQDFGDRR
jgi:hypothetical protein